MPLIVFVDLTSGELATGVLADAQRKQADRTRYKHDIQPMDKQRSHFAKASFKPLPWDNPQPFPSAIWKTAAKPCSISKLISCR